LPLTGWQRRRSYFTRGITATGSVYDLVFLPDKEQKFIYMIDAIKGEVGIVP
jgi:hypothetical protein